MNLAVSNSSHKRFVIMQSITSLLLVLLLVLVPLYDQQIHFVNCFSGYLHTNRGAHTDRSFVVITSMSRSPPMNDIDVMCVENVAEFCLQVDEIAASTMNASASGCDLEEYEALVNQLKDQKAILDEKSNYIQTLLNRLENQDDDTAASPASTYIPG